MRRFVIAACIVLSICAGRASATTASDSLLNADRALAALSHRIGFVAAYERAMGDDPRKLDAGSPTARGRSAVLAMVNGYGAQTQVDWTPEEAFVASSGDFGYTWGHFRVSGRDKTGKIVYSYGRYLDVWRRGSDGKWRWIADIATDDPPSSRPKSYGP
jgi:ketosteroid isomerase-like protein